MKWSLIQKIAATQSAHSRVPRPFPRPGNGHFILRPT
jgi:hypothetical protein